MKNKKSVRGKIGVERGFGPQHMANSKEGEPVDLTKVNTDTVPAMLSPREAVLTRNAAELAGRDNIEALNAEGNQLAEKGVDLAAKGDNDVANLNGKQLWDAIMTALQGRQAPAEKLGPVPVPGAMAQKGTSDMKSKVKQSKPAASGSPYVQAFQKLMPGGGAPVGYQGGGNVPRNIRVGSLIGYPAGGTDPNTQSWVPNPAYNSNGGGGGMPGGAGPTNLMGSPQGTQNVNQWGKPYGWNPQAQPQPVGGGMPGVGAGTPFGGGGMPGMQGPGIPGQNVNQWGKAYGWNPPGKVMGLAGGTQDVQGPIGTPPQGEQAYGPPVQLTSPQIQQLAKQTGISPTQLMGLMKAFQGGQSAYNSIGGGGYANQSPSAGEDFGNPNYIGLGTPSYQGGISDIGYPPFVAPGADYDGHRGGWLGPYDPSFMIQRYAGGISSVPFR